MDVISPNQDVYNELREFYYVRYYKTGHVLPNICSSDELLAPTMASELFLFSPKLVYLFACNYFTFINCKRDEKVLCACRDRIECCDLFCIPEF